MTRRLVTWLDDRFGASRPLGAALRYVFPDNWSFLLGEIALYAFVVLLVTGIYLTLFFEPSTATHAAYHGAYAPLRGTSVTPAFDSTMRISFQLRAGLLVRQTHHWAALVFVAAIVVHMLRVFFTGAFRKPREATWVIGVVMLMLAILEGFAGYSLPDDLLSGMGLEIANAVAKSVPLVGGQLAQLIWGGEPPTAVFEPRLFIVHVLILPVVLASLLALHLALVARPHHTQFAEPGHREDNVVGSPMWPRYALRATGLFAATAGVLVLLGGLVQINPVWIWGPYEPFLGSNGAQPDWYMGWLIGALRLMPGFDVHVGSYTLIPNPFWGGVLFPSAVFSLLLLWPFIERRLAADYYSHNLLDRPRERPLRTAFGAGLLTFVLTVFFAGAADRLFLSFGIGYETQVWVFRALLLAAPLAVAAATWSICRELVAIDRRPPAADAGEARAPAGDPGG